MEGGGGWRGRMERRWKQVCLGGNHYSYLSLLYCRWSVSICSMPAYNNPSYCTTRRCTHTHRHTSTDGYRGNRVISFSRLCSSSPVCAREWIESINSISPPDMALNKSSPWGEHGGQVWRCRWRYGCTLRSSSHTLIMGILMFYGEDREACPWYWDEALCIIYSAH